MFTNLPKEEIDLINMLKLLEDTFIGKNTKKVEEAKNKLEQIEIKYRISLLLKALTIDSIQSNKISRDLHKSVVVCLKNILYKKAEAFSPEELLLYINKLMEILLTNKTNSNLNQHSIISMIQSIITNLASCDKMVQNKNFLIQLFEILLKSIKNATKENFLQAGKIVILLCSSLLISKSADTNNYEKLIDNYYMPIINIIFANVPNYIDPKNNIYNEDFICILKHLYDGIYTNLSKLRQIIELQKRKEISLKFFREYGAFSLELIQLSPNYDENTAKKYGKPNPIVVFNINEEKCNEINVMKSKALQFLSFVTQVSTLTGKVSADEIKNFIDDKELVELINKVIRLIVNSFEDILSNQEKYYFLKQYKQEISEEEDCFNILLFQMYIFLTRSLVREPIKTEFVEYMKQFLLNILFPMIVTLEDEINFLEIDPEGYHGYINDLTEEYKIKNYRTAGCFLVHKICEKYEDMYQFISSFCIEMFNFILNGGKINSEFMEYNVYLKNIKDTLINKFNDKIKIDFALLIILILKYNLKNTYQKKSLIQILINNQDKINLITSPIIKIKLCKLYNYILTKLFGNFNDINELNKKKFIENTINYLLNNIMQSKLSGESIKDNYLQALSSEASDTITDLLSLPVSELYPDNRILNFYICQSLEKNFSILNKIIEYVDVYSFFLVIDQILKNIKINERNLLFECIINLTKKFQKDFLRQNSENKLFGREYFDCLNSFLTGVNKIAPNNKEEIKKLNEILDPIINYIKQPKKFKYYEELVSLMEEYIKCLDGVNERSALVLKSIKLILDEEKTTSKVTFSFTSTFLFYIQKNISEEPLDQAELFKEILLIINKSFAFDEDSIETSKIYALLLTLQILNLNLNLPEDVYSFLINKSLSSFEYIELNDSNNFAYDRNNINQLSLANVSLGFIFKPSLTFEILKKKIKISENKEILYFNKFCNLLIEINKITYPDYNPLLGKCIILGICGILTNQNCIDYLNENKKMKLYLIRIFLHIILFHKREKTKILNVLMKKELNCNFVTEDENNDEEEEEEEEEDEIDIEFNEKVESILNGNGNIKNSDEFKYYTQVMRLVKEKDIDIYNSILEEVHENTTKLLDNLFKVRNITIKYKNKELTVPRKTLKIIKKLK